MSKAMATGLHAARSGHYQYRDTVESKMKFVLYQRGAKLDYPPMSFSCARDIALDQAIAEHALVELVDSYGHTVYVVEPKW